MKAESNFSRILNGQTAKSFDLVKSYVENHPEARDAEQAREWLFSTAIDNGWEAQATELANRYLMTPGELPLKSLAAKVRILGWAKAGQWDEALLDYERQLASVRLRMPTEIVDVAKLLAVEAQAAGRPETAREIYQNLSRTLFLNPDVKTLCDTKLAKLALIGKPAPAVTVKSLKGEAFNLADFQGKWVLLDFWATNCPPCIKDLPALKEMYETYHGAGLEIIGISLDEDAETVLAFQKNQKLRWALGRSGSDQGKTREAYHVPTIPAMYLISPQERSC